LDAHTARRNKVNAWCKAARSNKDAPQGRAATFGCLQESASSWSLTKQARRCRSSVANLSLSHISRLLACTESRAAGGSLCSTTNTEVLRRRVTICHAAKLFFTSHEMPSVPQFFRLSEARRSSSPLPLIEPSAATTKPPGDISTVSFQRAASSCVARGSAEASAAKDGVREVQDVTAVGSTCSWPLKRALAIASARCC